MLSSSGLISDCGICRASAALRPASPSAPKPSGMGRGKLGSGAGFELERRGGIDDRDGGIELVCGGGLEGALEGKGGALGVIETD